MESTRQEGMMHRRYIQETKVKVLDERKRKGGSIEYSGSTWQWRIPKANGEGCSFDTSWGISENKEKDSEADDGGEQ